MNYADIKYYIMIARQVSNMFRTPIILCSQMHQTLG